MKSELSDSIDKRSGLVSIGQAADILDVSIDTVRRWDKAGIIKSTRLDGKNRYFSVEELERVKLSQPLSISEAADRLEISTSTLRRLEDQGLITPARNSNGERIYDRDTLQEFLDSKYFMRQKGIEQEVLEPLSRHSEGVRDARHIGHDPVAQVMLTEQKKSVRRLHKFRKNSLTTVLVIADILILLVTTIASLFVLFPDSTLKVLGYEKAIGVNKQFPFHDASSLLARELRPFSNLAIELIGTINPSLRLRISPPMPIQNVNDVFATDGRGSIVSRYTFTVANSSFLKIPDQGLITNLNSDLVQGKQPGQNVGDLAVLPLDTNQIKDGAITLSKLSPGAIGLLNSLKVTPSLPQSAASAAGPISVLPSGGDTLTISSTPAIGDIQGSFGTGLSLVTSSVLPGNYGSSSSIGAFTVDSKGRLINASNTAINIDTSAVVSGALSAVRGGTGQSTYSDGQLIIGNSNTGSLSKATLTAGSGVTITNGNGSITIAAVASGTCASCANVSLSNLSGVAINASLLSGAATIDLGSASNPFRDIYLGGTATSNFRFTGSATAARTLTVPDASGTIAVSASGNIALSGAGNITVTGQIPVANGGTGVGTLTTNGVLYGNGTSALQATVAGTSGQLLLANASAVPTFTTLSGDATIVSSGSLTLANSGVTAGSYGSASSVGNFTVDSKGRLTSASTTAIALDATAITSGALLVPRGGTGATTFTSNGLLYGNGTGALQVTSAGTGGQLLLANASAVPTFTTLSGDATLASSGALTLVTSGVTSGSYGTATAVGTFTVDAKGRITTASNTSITGLNINTTTTGNYVDSISAGNGIAVSGGSGHGSTPTVSINLNSTSPGLESTGSGLSLLRSCSTNQFLQWNGSGWVCDTNTLQQAYNASSSPQIVLTSAGGGLAFQDNATPIVGNLFAVQSNGGGTNYLSVTATTVTLGGDTTVSAGKNFALASGGGIITQTYTGNSTATTVNANSATSGTGLALNITGLTSGSGLIITGGSSLTSGGLLSLTGASYNHSAANEIGNISSISFTDASANTNGGGTTSGLNIASTLNTSGAGAKTINGANVATPVLTGCASGACTWNGYNVGLATNTNSLITQNGLNISTTGTSTAGTINGINIANITSGAATKTAIQVGTGWNQGLAIGVTPNSSTGRTVDVAGNWGGSQVSDLQTVGTTQTITESTKALVYDLENNTSATTAFTATFNITGLPDTDGTYAYLYTKCTGPTTVTPSSVAIKVNGSAAVSTATCPTVNGSTIKSFTLVRVNGTWRPIGGTGAADTADLAEWTSYVGDRPLPGEIVTLADPANDEVRVRKTSHASDKAIVGVVSTAPNTVMSEEKPDRIQLALSGRVPVKVSTENGPIRIGDYLTSSSTPGVAMRATKAGPTIGKSMEAFNGSVGSVQMFVNTSYYSGDGLDEIVPPGLGVDSKSDSYRLSVLRYLENVTPAKAEDLSKIMTDRVVSGLDVMSPNVFTDHLHTSTIEPSGQAITFKGSRGAILATIDSSGVRVGGDLTIDGSLKIAGTTEFKGDVSFEGRPTFDRDTAGFTQIKAGQTVAHVSFEKEYAFPPVISVTLGDGKFTQYSYNNLSTRGFDIVVATPANQDLNFSWISLSVKN